VIYTKLPTTTQILKPWMNLDWFKPEHAERGSAVHRAISTRLKGAWNPPVKAEYQGYVDSAFRWIDAMVDEIILIETRLVDESLKYCGKPDLIPKLKGDDCFSMVDWKTAVAKDQFRVWPPQIASYRNLAKVDRGFETGRGMSVRLREDGKMPLVDEYTDTYEADFRAFECALYCHYYFPKKEQ